MMNFFLNITFPNVFTHLWGLRPFLYRVPIPSDISSKQFFNWSTIEPLSNLSWVDCYSDYQCTRFQVPIDYSNEDGDKAALAVIKLPAQSETQYKGAILMNPGGPGGRGVAFLLSLGSSLASVVGNQYDIISFDPWVGNSTPRVEFFPSKEEHSQWLAVPDHWTTVFNTTSDEIPHLWASAQVIAQLAEQRDAGFMNYISTDNIARDMLRINEAAGQVKLHQSLPSSYGTVLGSTFATMFPHKVERIVLDGVLDMDRYYRNHTTLRDGWHDDTVDADADMQSFFDGCVAAGPDRCAFFSPTATEVSNSLDHLYDSIIAQPVPFVTPSSYGIVDYTVLRAAVRNAMCSPYNYFSELAEGLALLAAGDGSRIYALQETAYGPSSVEDLFAYWETVKGLSGFSDLLFHRRISCSGWKFHREGVFRGPITANTSYPILFIGNTADPLTPLSLAKKTSCTFPGSIVLTQNSSGHTSLAAWSACRNAHVQAYFQNGILPDDETVCEVESEMFPVS
ncbi:TAP-like protein-domain-containing protein [Armillaria luteobubalina]|uniref:TAP-like protein-domain-containing protein n=1 Tax=Armillaria luteobubalina TaxID=153913 RepID=A0AA39P917_9AGAR|nr:TAP-like protein-domain-containing protein [Armillaria luteobubalina]